MLSVQHLLETHWQLAVEKVIPVGPVWKIEAVQGDFCLKRGKRSLSRLMFDHHAIEYLWRQGFTRTPRLIPTVHGEAINRTDDGNFFLTRWVGRPLNPHAKAEWLAAAAVLGDFHHLSSGLSLPPQSTAVFFSSRWTRRFAERTEELQLALAALERPQNAFEDVVRRDAAQILSQAKRATDLLMRSDYERMVQEVQQMPTLVHGNVKGENFAIDAQGQVSLIDFDAFRLDVPVSDLVNLFQNVLPGLNWSPEDALDILAAYHRARPVAPAEIEVLLALLSFPHQAYKELHKYKQQADRPLEKALRKWHPAVNEMYQTDEFLKKWAILLEKRVQ